MTPPEGLAVSPEQQARAAQHRAANPRASVFVAASAGSGKTKLLTDRLQRLLLAGVKPSRLLCLTYTRAAAAEMATRLARVLGDWAVLGEPTLRARLRDLLERDATTEEVARARTLFAQVLDLPGGMRISTLHAFAQSLLRGFPLEAGIVPGFSLFEDADERAALALAREEVLPGHPAMPLLASLADATTLAELTEDLSEHEGRLRGVLQRAGGEAALLAALADALGLPAGATHEALVAEAAAPPEADAVHRAASELVGAKNENDRERGAAIRAWLALGPEARADELGRWEAIFLTKEGTPRKSFATKGGLGARAPAVHEALSREAERLAARRERTRALALHEATAAALSAGLAVLDRLDAAKREQGRQSYDDLIRGASGLLDDPGAAWVLFKLDGGLDHVLVDEAQDSNPAQWEIVARLTEEFFSGSGAVERERTVFAVGDVKQSIFSFQGADAEGLPRARERFRQLAADAKKPFEPERLEVSFRSAPAVLDLVDAVFAAGPARDGVVLEAGETLHHRPSREGAAGIVELWPLQAAEDEPPPPDWAVPEVAVAAQGPDARLAKAVALRIRDLIDNERLDARWDDSVGQGAGRGDGVGRPIRPEDILVLVRKRDGFAAQLIRALKELGVRVGGLDRLKLVENIAVRDVLATLDAVLLPEDDLQLAAALKSPIFDLDEGDLFALCHGREGALHRELMHHRGEDSPAGRAADLLAELSARAGHVPPHALIAELLGERGGRRRLLARLGPDASDPLDELLNAALAHERAHPPSLQGFLHWLRIANAEIKREPEGAGGAVRVMTVHGAKGLQAPIVILPHTVSQPPRESGLRWTPADAEGGALPLWVPRKDGFDPPLLAAAAQARRERERREDHRLLYVALTRAEDRLLVCGFFKKQKADESWHDLIRAGMERLGAAEVEFAPEHFGAERAGFQAGPMLVWHSPQTAPRRHDPRRTEAVATQEPPEWARRKLAERAVEPRPLTPSREADAEVPPAAPHLPADPLGRRFRRGTLLHGLLQTLPDMEEGKQGEAARRFLARPVHGLGEAERAELLAEVFAVMAMPELAEAFGPGSLAEAPIAARTGDGQVIIGVVDRIVVRPGRVVVLDYKTNRPPPATPEGTPPAYLRQMALYRHALRLAFPGRHVECALVWTYAARAMVLPAALLDEHAPPGTS